MFKNNSSTKMILALKMHMLFFVITLICVYICYRYMGSQNSALINIVGFFGLITGSIIVSLPVIKSITKQIDSVIEDLTQTSTDVLNASSSLAGSSHKLAEGSAEQSASVQETSATMEETSSLVQQTTQNTKEAVALAENAKAEATTGVVGVQKLLGSMSELEKSSEEVQKIIKVIDDMAFQTNILSLNAAVEAARAGDAGKGFAVVAEEVRNLAQRSAQAARETAVLIDGNVNLTKSAVHVSNETGEVLKRIDTSVSKVKELLDEISTASQEQVIAAGQIAQAITQIDHVVQTQSQVAQVSAQGADQLEEYCLNLKEVMVQLVSVVRDPGKGMESSGSAARIETKSVPTSHRIASKNSERRGGPPAAAPKKEKLSGAKAVTPEDVIPLGDF